MRLQKKLLSYVQDLAIHPFFLTHPVLPQYSPLKGNYLNDK